MIRYHKYSLRSNGALNAVSREFNRSGILIRTENGGYGCIHPWPELGDSTLEQEIQGLKAGTPLPLGQRALQCAEVDAEARNRGVHLLDGLKLPESHATLSPAVSPSSVYTMNKYGFRVGKIKALPSRSGTEERLAILSAIAPTWKWRIDFNGSLTLDKAVKFWNNLHQPLKDIIEFIEDPCPYTYDGWKQLSDMGMPIACDLASDMAFQPELPRDLPVVRVIKPAREPNPPSGTGEYIFTSVMDHPLGQVWATYQAALYYKQSGITEMPLCGLCTHHLFHEDDFTRALGGLSTTITIPQGTGLGFDHLLEKLPWEPLH